MRKPQNLKKNLPPVLTKQLILLSSTKQLGDFFQIFVAFSEKLDFVSSRMKKWHVLHSLGNQTLSQILRLWKRVGKLNKGAIAFLNRFPIVIIETF